MEAEMACMPNTYLLHDFPLPGEKPDGTDLQPHWIDEPCGWFTSLWTLQEFFLRPDMMMVDSNWELFILLGPVSLAVTVDLIVALQYHLSEKEECALANPDLPGPVFEAVYASSGAARIMLSSRIGLLTAAQAR